MGFSEDGPNQNLVATFEDDAMICDDANRGNWMNWMDSLVVIICCDMFRLCVYVYIYIHIYIHIYIYVFS